MSETIVLGIAGVIGTLIGGLGGSALGWRLNERSTKQREQLVEGRQRESARLLVSEELDYDLSLFRDYWMRVKSANLRQALGDEPEDEMSQMVWRSEAARFWARSLVATTPPTWSNEMWRGLGASLALLSPTEIASGLRVYRGLDEISAIREDLIEPATERPYQHTTQSAIGGAPRIDTIYPQRFNSRAPAAWARCEEIAEELLRSGNPLAASRDKGMILSRASLRDG